MKSVTIWKHVAKSHRGAKSPDKNPIRDNFEGQVKSVVAPLLVLLVIKWYRSWGVIAALRESQNRSVNKGKYVQATIKGGIWPGGHLTFTDLSFAIIYL